MRSSYIIVLYNYGHSKILEQLQIPFQNYHKEIISSIPDFTQMGSIQGLH